MLDIIMTITGIVVATPILFCIGMVAHDFVKDIKLEYSSSRKQ